ncbi:MAG: glycine dehydrogenase (aminomethyl-transferring) [Proteobacteria bacterium]|nr:glycine dehydrogenase (aminomethyl-transferring) [Pseudomonadota bacterium]
MRDETMSENVGVTVAMTPEDSFEGRHIGPSAAEQAAMLSEVGCASFEELISKVVPPNIRFKGRLNLGGYSEPRSETKALATLKSLLSQNKLARSFIGAGYSSCITPPVILRNLLENPGWYTQYTPYQPEISQGRLEALLNYQTMICDLTGLAISNASLLDEGTAAAEAMALSLHTFLKGGDEATTGLKYFVSDSAHPQTIEVLRTRAGALGVEVVVGSAQSVSAKPDSLDKGVFGALLQYPGTFGEIVDYRTVIAKLHEKGIVVTMAADLLGLVLLTSPGELGADIAVGSSQRFGVPLGFGGPHAAYFATKDEFKRMMPGRLIGVSKDAAGNPALRLALQTREQHIRREKATSNICTAQVLLANIAGMYAVYHGPKGLTRIATRVHEFARRLAGAIKAAGKTLLSEEFFDTVSVKLSTSERAAVLEKASHKGINLRATEFGVSVALDEATTEEELKLLCELFGAKGAAGFAGGLPSGLKRATAILTHPVFNRYHSETDFLRYMRRLESRDLSLATAMIPLGSCTMKLNATTEMIPVTWPEVGALHPFVPSEQARGYHRLFADLEQMLCAVTGFDAVSLQPNAGSQGEYAGLLAIRGYHDARGDLGRRVCLIPKSAHGTNPASAVMAGFKVVVVECDEKGNIDIADLKAKVAEHGNKVACLMATYPSTHGVFEQGITEVCEVVHSVGGQVYMDGANLNALVGVCRPVDIGADVCHINLHKTFCIPHGGGGPGMGPIGVRKHLAPFLPTHPLVDNGVQTLANHKVGPVSAAPWGSASILVISWTYMVMMGSDGLRRATENAILNANYISKRLEPHYPTLYRGAEGYVAHECILDLREIKRLSGVEVEDVAKRLMDYGFHAPTVSFPVAGTLMVEPTESESKAELDRFCDAMIAIREEIRAIEEGRSDKLNNPLKNAPHTALAVTASEWTRPYSREVAAFPTKFTREAKFWPSVARVDGNYGDRNLVCSCLPIDEYK